MSRRQLLAGAAALATAVPLAPARAERTLRLGLLVPGTHQWSKAAVQFGEELTAATDGRYSLTVFPSSQLGTEAQMVQQLQTGALDMAWITTAELCNRLVDLAALHAPFLAADMPKARAVLDGEIATGILSKLPASIGARGIGFGMTGMRHIVTRDESSGLDDIRGKKIRVIPSAPARDFYDLLGAAPTPIPLSSVYDAMANGQVDGIDMDFEATYYAKFYQLSKTMLVTNHVMNPMAALVSMRLWASISDADRETIQMLVNRQLTAIKDEMVANETVFRDRLVAEGLMLKSLEPGSFLDVVAAWDAKWRERLPNLDALRASAG
jgi:TRAP-type C4-dicarboxylate transport system substrate-binding protein